MGDIVNELRSGGPCSGDIGCANELCSKAAAEIERLRNALKKVESIGNETLNSWPFGDNCKVGVIAEMVCVASLAHRSEK